MMKSRKGIVLYSGGLDSLLTAKLLAGQGIEVIGLHCIAPSVAPDCDPRELKSSRLAASIGLNLRFYRCEKEYMQIVEKPKHGHGKNINPCIDCKIHFLRQAKRLMEEEGAAFVATGEVVGQRPMSQMRDMLRHIEKESGLEGYLLRPLCARLLTPTHAENEGIVDREQLLAISGRGRKIQMDMADAYGITDYASPAGGCFLTDSFMAGRMRDLFSRVPAYTMIDVYLLTIGRHLRLHDRAKFIISRNEHETDELTKYQQHADFFYHADFTGPVIFGRGTPDRGDLDLIARAHLRYRNRRDSNNRITVWFPDREAVELRPEDPLTDDDLKRMMI